MCLVFYQSIEIDQFQVLLSILFTEQTIRAMNTMGKIGIQRLYLSPTEKYKLI
jgi:hypothetical protein